MNREAGKGSKPREGANQQAFETGWDRIFGKKEKQCSDQKEVCDKCEPGLESDKRCCVQSKI